MYAIMNKPLSDYITLHRRYARSINLERDILDQDALDGYVLTERGISTLKRFIQSINNQASNRAYTITSVYGTGKSAFAHFLTSLCGPQDDPLRIQAEKIAKKYLGKNSNSLIAKLPAEGLFRAVAVSQREPISYTIIRALHQGAKTFWNTGRNKNTIQKKLTEYLENVNEGENIDNKKIINLVKEIGKTSQTGILLVIDELGKSLEYISHHQSKQDLFLLQQLSELRLEDSPVHVIGLLHQSFADYGEKLTTVQRNEWAKIQGRFEDVPFQESSAQMVFLISQVINQTEKFSIHVDKTFSQWWNKLPKNLLTDINQQVLTNVYPLHPVTALVLPHLCTRYGQNDRSLFTFLTSTEPYSLNSFLSQTDTDLRKNYLPTVKLDYIYNYFVESVGLGSVSRQNLQRWLEIQRLIEDAEPKFDEDDIRVLKTIGILNLVTITGVFRATPSLVALSLCDTPDDQKSIDYYEKIIDRLLQKGIITYRRQLDELRIWQGSDFNIDIELANYLQQETSNLADILTKVRPLAPLVAQRHSYETGTLRYFERRYLDEIQEINELVCQNQTADGLLVYWVGQDNLENLPTETIDGKPLVILCASQIDGLEIASKEFAALENLKNQAVELQTDQVARLEVNYRLSQAEELLDDSFNMAFDMNESDNIAWFNGESESFSHISYFYKKLSEICDEVYPQGLKLRNELINCRELTSQGITARRELMTRMIQNSNQENLGLIGFGPEVSMYNSVLKSTEIHRQEDGEWGFYPPTNENVSYVWEAIQDFCTSAEKGAVSLDQIYGLLASPPYGVKREIIPILLLSVILYHKDDVGLYQDGKYIPILETEHWEIFVRQPQRFSVKYFALLGLRSQLFQELQAIWGGGINTKNTNVRNVTLLTAVKPLFQFVKKLPAYTKNTQNLDDLASNVLEALKTAQEPDELLFTTLPVACGLSPIKPNQKSDTVTAKNLCKKLSEALHKIQTAYEELLKQCLDRMDDAFGVSTQDNKLRDFLQLRCQQLLGQAVEPFLKRFIIAATDKKSSNQEWLEALLMIIADKPAESWSDQDVISFEVKVSDLARRFKNLEALQIETPNINLKSKGKGKKTEVEARRITVTRPDGGETNQIVWIETETTSEIDELIEKCLSDRLLNNNPKMQHAFLARLTEKILGQSP